ncbi:hypothetical protein PHISCL_07894 [Aspergillus sclerotialis]|uniref:Uncharacterized protein n=1 Tax=Aspergillus sclerotialis TaxID=2070753 RepID=A0A3A2Z9G5_9EURO|nr:hypothetical protein PHISCL_07894 [Aspergillus sclerotialis]
MGKDFAFVNVTRPQDALKLAKEPEIRAHVTRYQWKQIERRETVAYQRKRKFLTICMESEDTAVYSTENPDSRPDPASMQIQQQTMPTLRPPEDTTEFSQRDSNPDQDNKKAMPTLPPPWMLPAMCIPPQLGGLRVDPFRSYPIPFKPYLPLLVDHYLMIMAVDIPELDQPGNRGLLRTSWFPLVMTDPSLFLVIMLLAASHHAAAYNRSMETKMNLLALRCEAINSINRALAAQPPDALSDALVGAIAKMASYEAMFGTMDSYDVHMKGLTKAVGLRGGLSSLGLNGLLRRIVVWIDRNSAFLHGSPLFFPGATFVPGQPLPDPNPGHFLGAS